jgi:HK97 gp10 family phage protein
MNIEMKITPTFEKLGKAFNRAGKDVNKAMMNMLEEYARYTERYAKQVTPVDTGRLRTSIGYEMGNMEARVGTHNVKYATFVHEGTSKMRARPFLKWGFEFAGRKFTDKSFASRLDKELADSFRKL